MKRRYLKDYIPDENGKDGFRYTGKLYLSNLSADRRKREGWTGIILGLAVMLFTLAAISVNCMGNRTVYVVLPLEFTLLCYGYYLSGMHIFLKAGNRMEQRVYDGAFLRTAQSVTIALILLIFVFLGELFVILRHKGGIGPEEYYFLSWTAVVFLLTVILWKKQRKLITEVKEE